MLFSADNHPKVITRNIKAEEAREIFLKGMVRKSKNGTVTKEAFVDYYA